MRRWSHSLRATVKDKVFVLLKVIAISKIEMEVRRQGRDIYQVMLTITMRRSQIELSVKTEITQLARISDRREITGDPAVKVLNTILTSTSFDFPDNKNNDN